MENRIFVGTQKDTTEFFNDVKRFGKFDTWANLQSFLKISRSHLGDIRTQKLSLSEKTYAKLISFLPKEKVEHYQSLRIIKPANWGLTLAGKTTYQRHPKIFEKGRKAGLQKMLLLSKSPAFDSNQPLTKELCEFLGAFAGDGFTNKYGCHYIVGFTGDSRLDYNYYENTIIPIAKKLFSIKPYVGVKDNTLRVNFHSKQLFELLTQRFKMPTGVKYNTVQIPQEVQNGEVEHKTAFIRGTFDTDGCVFFDNRKTYKTPYLRLDLTMYNPHILDQIANHLKEIGVPAKRLSNEKHLQITSKQDVESYLAKVGSSNPRHITKILKKFPNFTEYNPATKNKLFPEKP